MSVVSNAIAAWAKLERALRAAEADQWAHLTAMSASELQSIITEISPALESLLTIIAAHEQYKADCPNVERDPIYEAIEAARATP